MNEHIRKGNEALSRNDRMAARAEFELALSDSDETVRKVANNRLMELQLQPERVHKSSKLHRDRPQEGWLGFCGYHVGQKGLTKEARQEKLREAFEGNLPKPRFNGSEILWWGPPRSAQRYHIICDRIMGFIRERLEKLKNEGQDQNAPVQDAAVRDWWEDYAWIKEAFGNEGADKK